MEGFFAGESVPVNQRLSDIFLQLHISERTGRGVPKITGVYGKKTYEFRENSIVVSIPFSRVSDEVIPPVIPSVIPPVEENLNEYRILQFCSNPKGILEIAGMLKYKDKKTVRRYIKPLIEQGRLTMTIPDKPNSQNQKYVTIK